MKAGIADGREGGGGLRLGGGAGDAVATKNRAPEGPLRWR